MTAAGSGPVKAAGIERARALICEDEPLARRALREYLKDVPWVEVVGEATEGREALRSIQKLEPDLVFLDVRMPNLSGIEVLEVATHQAAVVFTTAYDEYALTAFELGAVDYLMKPFGRERLLETLARVRVRLVGQGAYERRPPGRGRPARRLFGRRRGSLVPVRSRDVVRIEAGDGGATVVTDAGRLAMDATLTELEARLDSQDFVRVHRSHIVNLEHVERVRRYDERRLELRFDDGSTVVASRQGSKLLRDVMG